MYWTVFLLLYIVLSDIIRFSSFFSYTLLNNSCDITLLLNITTCAYIANTFLRENDSSSADLILIHIKMKPFISMTSRPPLQRVYLWLKYYLQYVVSSIFRIMSIQPPWATRGVFGFCVCWTDDYLWFWFFVMFLLNQPASVFYFFTFQRCPPSWLWESDVCVLHVLYVDSRGFFWASVATYL